MPAREKSGRGRGRLPRTEGPDPAEQLMRVALQLFAQRDFATVTIKDLAKTSGFDSALIYYYFRDKQHLFDEAVKFALSESLGAIQRLHDAAEHPVQAIRNWLAHCKARAAQNRTVFRIMFHYAGSPVGAPGLEGLVQQFYASEETDVLASSIARGVQAGLFARVDAVEVAHFVSVHLDGITSASILRRDFDVNQAIDDLERVLLAQLRYAEPAEPGDPAKVVRLPGRRR